MGEQTTYTSEEIYNGSQDTRVQRENLNWRVLSTEGRRIKIISDVSTQQLFYSGTYAYNNAVKDLNDMCETLYSHGNTKARSVNLEDFKGQPRSN